MSMYEQRAVLTGGIQTLTVPPMNLLPSRCRKAAEKVDAMQVAHDEAAAKVKMLERSRGTVVKAHQQAIAQALMDSQPRPVDPAPAHDADIAAAKDDAAGARLAHGEAVERFWSAIPKRDSKAVQDLIATVCEQQETILNECDHLVGLFVEMHEAHATLRFLQTAETKQHYRVPPNDATKTLYGLKASVDDLATGFVMPPNEPVKRAR